MKMQITSMQSYEHLIPLRSKRCKEAYRILVGYIQATGDYPTGAELRKYCGDLDILKRLTDLCDKYGVIHRGERRQCNTNPDQESYPLIPGAAEGEEAGKTPWNENVHERLLLLRAYEPSIGFKKAEFILQCGQPKLKRVWDGRAMKTTIGIQTDWTL